MERPRRNQDRLAAADGDPGRDVHDATLANRGRQGVGGRIGPDAHQDPGIRRGLEEEPRLGLAELVGPDHSPGLIVVRVDLDREPVGAVEELDQEREARSEAIGGGRSQESGAALGRQVGQPAAGQRLRRNHTLAESDPGLTDGRI